MTRDIEAETCDIGNVCSLLTYEAPFHMIQLNVRPSFQRNDFCANNMGDGVPTARTLGQNYKEKLNGCIETTENDHTYFQIVVDFRA